MLVKNIFKVVSSIWYIITWFLATRSQIKKILQDLMGCLGNDIDKLFTNLEIRRIRQYMLFSAFLADLFCVLSGRKIKLKEKKCTLYMGALAPIYDDFFDKNIVSEKRIKELTFHYKDVRPTNLYETIFLFLFKNFYKYAENATVFNKIFKKLLQAQNNSKYLSLSKENNDHIKQIYCEKGGYTALLIRKILIHPLSKREEKAVYELGILMQFMDDIFDIYEDSRNKNYSLAYPISSISKLSSNFQKQLQYTFSLFYKLSYKKRNIQRFLYRFMLIASKNLVCLKQLEKVERKFKLDFELHNLDRKILICDMEKFSNILKSLYYTIVYTYKNYDNFSFRTVKSLGKFREGK